MHARENTTCAYLHTRSLLILSLHHPALCSCLQAKIAELGGIEVLINAMREHLSKPLVQQYGATALRNLTLHNAENKKAIARLKGIEALISAMEAHSTVAVVQQCVATGPHLAAAVCGAALALRQASFY